MNAKACMSFFRAHSSSALRGRPRFTSAEVAAADDIVDALHAAMFLGAERSKSIRTREYIGAGSGSSSYTQGCGSHGKGDYFLKTRFKLKVHEYALPMTFLKGLKK